MLSLLPRTLLPLPARRLSSPAAAAIPAPAGLRGEDVALPGDDDAAALRDGSASGRDAGAADGRSAGSAGGRRAGAAGGRSAGSADRRSAGAADRRSAGYAGGLRAEFVRLHYAIEALRAEDRPVVLQFLASSPGEGTSTVAEGFAAVAAAERPHATLLVDCHGDAVPQPGGTVPTLVEAFREGIPLRAATFPEPTSRMTAVEGLWRARLGRGANPLLALSGAELKRLFEALGESFATVALDCPAASASPDSVALSRHCDGSVLVVRAGAARAGAVAQTARAVERAGGQLVGCVLNRQRRSLPGWLDRRL